MKSFEKALKRRILLVASFAILFNAALIATFILKRLGIAGIDSVISEASLIGMFAGITSVTYYRVKKYLKALKSQENLEALHIKETDERNRAISLSASTATLYSTFTLLGIAGIIMSFFNKTACFTIGVILIVMLIMYAVFSLCYSKRY